MSIEANITLIINAPTASWMIPPIGTNSRANASLENRVGINKTNTAVITLPRKLIKEICLKNKLIIKATRMIP